MKKILLTLLLLSSSLLALKAQGTWTPRDTLPDSAMFQGISGFAIGNYGYAGVGDNVAGKTEDYFWQFDPSTDKWTRKANFPGSARIAPASFVIGRYAYLVTGSIRNGSTCVTECWQYNATNNTWTQKTNFPGGARTYAVGFAIGGKGYVGTGANELHDFYKDFYAYDTTGSGSWTKIADLPAIARSAASGFGVNGKGYVCFGQDSLFGGSWLNKDMWQYDPGNNTWTQKSDCPGLPMYEATGFVICDNIYVGSGDDSSVGFDHAFWKYNTSADSWTPVTPPPGPSKLQGAAFAVSDTGYYGFGSDSTGYQIPNAFDKFYAGDSCSVVEGYSTVSPSSPITIFPNPSNGIFTLNYYTFSSATQNTIQVFNSLGLKVYDVELPQPDEYEINLSNLSSGVYIASIHLANQTFYKKLIINH